jgi:hypothetical protein
VQHEISKPPLIKQNTKVSVFLTSRFMFFSRDIGRLKTNKRNRYCELPVEDKTLQGRYPQPPTGE